MADQKSQYLWERYEYARDRGHRQYVAQATLCENFYLGEQVDDATGLRYGGQWRDADRQHNYSNRRPVHEFNVIWPAVNIAMGYQLNNRMEATFRPRGGLADQETADILSKVFRSVSDQNQLKWLETQVWGDGLIEQRGYFDIRMSFEENLAGDIEISVIDPRDGVPDPDASSYDPKDWNDWMETKWWSIDEIEQNYGPEAAEEVINTAPQEEDFGFEYEGRNKFGDAYLGRGLLSDPEQRQRRRIRVIERQVRRLETVPVLIHPTGEIQRISPDWGRERVQATINETGAVPTKRRLSTVHWEVGTQDVMLHDEVSPYPWLTVVGFFPYFRRGKTRGIVDNGISPQEMLNKALSSYQHIVNTSANSGWITEENSLSNMTGEELEEKGGETGLHIEFKQGSTKPDKIQPNQIPTGVDKFIDRSEQMVKSITSISDAMQGLQGPEVSGVAIQSKQFMGQAALGGPIDNLERTRHILACRVRDLVQLYYTDHRILRLTEPDKNGEDRDVAVEINKPMGSQVLHDMTVGKYDVVVTSQPIQVTFDAGQFNQGIEMRREGVAIPDWVLVKHSNLEERGEVIKAMQDNSDPQKEAEIAEIEAKVAKLNAERDRIVSEGVNSAVEAQYSATQTAALIASIPTVSRMADKLLLSAGYEDKDEPPIVPALEGAPPAQGVEMPTNTNPLTPANPGVGVRKGIETPEVGPEE